MENPFKKAINNEINETDNAINTENESDKIEANSEADADINSESNENIDEQNKDLNTNIQEIESTDSELNIIKDKYEKLNNQYIRLAADFDNYRKRNEQEREALLKYGAEKTLKSMLEVIDNFERGLKALETVEDCEKVKECYNLAYKNFTDVLTKAGLEPIKAEGEIFNPTYHEAIMQTPTNEKPENTIIAELQKGYKMGDKVLRPTLVNVATEG